MTENIKEKKVKKDEVIDVYFKHLWNKKEKEGFNLAYHNDSLFLIKHNSHAYRNYHPINFNTLDELLENRKKVDEKKTFKISTDTNSDKEVFASIFVLCPAPIQKYMAKKALSFINYNYGLTRVVLEQCSLKKDPDSAKIYLENTPTSVELFDYHDFNNMFYQLFNKEESDQMYLKCVQLRCESLNRSYVQTQLKEFLLDKYKNEPEKLEKFTQYLPTLKSYLAGNEGHSIFYEKEENELTFMMDYEKLKGSLELDWNNKEYAMWVNSLLQIIAAKDKRVKRIYSDDIALNNHQTYKQIFVYVQPGEKIDEKSIKAYITKFICHLTQDINKTYTGASGRKTFITKWWNMNKLTDSLTTNEETVIKRTKI